MDVASYLETAGTLAWKVPNLSEDVPDEPTHVPDDSEDEQVAINKEDLQHAPPVVTLWIANLVQQQHPPPPKQQKQLKPPRGAAAAVERRGCNKPIDRRRCNKPAPAAARPPRSPSAPLTTEAKRSAARAARCRAPRWRSPHASVRRCRCGGGAKGV
mgnify:CR=1 FL=1